MKKPIFGGVAAVISSLALTGGFALAQQPAHTETTTKQTGPGPTVKTHMEWVTGTVEDYEPGKKIKVSGPGGKSYSFDLDEGARVHGTIVVGKTAKVGHGKTSDGREYVTVVSQASAAAQSDASAPRAHVESSVKTTGPGPNQKTKSETVVGVVREYEPGKSIKVVGPGDKEYRFDLDENAGVQGTFLQGDRVRVTYTKTASGDKVTTVRPAHGSK